MPVLYINDYHLTGCVSGSRNESLLLKVGEFFSVVAPQADIFETSGCEVRQSNLSCPVILSASVGHAHCASRYRQNLCVLGSR